jgi:hypothetical protein
MTQCWATSSSSRTRGCWQHTSLAAWVACQHRLRQLAPVAVARAAATGAVRARLRPAAVVQMRVTAWACLSRWSMKMASHW